MGQTFVASGLACSVHSGKDSVEAGSMAKPVSIKDIARIAGVSFSTVSRALNDSPRVNAGTRERIQRTAADMGYLPSAVARSLVTQRTQALGVVFTSVTDPLSAQILHTLEEAARDRGYSLIVSSSGGDPQRESRAIRRLRERRVDGIIVVCGSSGPDPFGGELGAGLAGVTINSAHRGPASHDVQVDHLDGGRQATQHLLELGHRRIGYISGAQEARDSTERRQGYERALEAWGLAPDPDLVVAGNRRPLGGAEAVAQLLALPGPPTALFCYNDATALGAIRGIRAAGWHVPQDISVVGFDDIDLAPYVEPPLTTVAQPIERLCLAALDTVLGQIAGRPAGEACVLPGQLIIRESTTSRVAIVW